MARQGPQRSRDHPDARLPPDRLGLVDHIAPIPQASGPARKEYGGTALREHVGLVH
ncbi:hypothetical protein [Streptomyces mirabilis]